MADYFWQGGRKIKIFEDGAQITVHASDPGDALSAAGKAGVELRDVAAMSTGMVRAKVGADRDTAMAKLRERRVVHHVYRDVADPNSEYLITDSFHLKFKKDTARERIVAYLSGEHLEIVQDLGDNLFLVRVTDETGRNPLSVANGAHELPDVEYAEPNLVRTLQRFSPPIDDLFARQWHLHAPLNEGNDLVQGAGVFALDAWEKTRGVRDIVVAVADDSFDLTHPDFQGTGKVVGAWNITPSNGTIAIDSDVSPRPGDYHGTPCAGVAIAEADGRGVVGVAPGCSFLAVRFPLNISDHMLLMMFERISRAADVVSCSWGYPPANAPMGSALRDGLTRIARSGGRRGKGLVICVAAGNNNAPIKDLDNTRTYRYRADGGFRSYSGPIDRWIAAHPDVITVSACTSRKWRSAYSSWGNEVWVCAPSDNWDDQNIVPVIGRGIVTTDNEGFGTGSDFTPGSRFTSDFGGTSSATPTVAGVCALILSQNPALTALEVKDVLKRTADKDLQIQSETPVNVAGGFAASGRSPWFGYGKVNAAKAVAAAAPVAVTATVQRKNTTAVPIPDRDEAVFSDIRCDDTRSIIELRISVDIKHTYVGDLRVDLITPNGATITLHNHTGGSSDNLVRVYSTQNAPALRALAGKPLNGTWRLRIVDSWKFDSGTLRSWQIDAKVTSPQPAMPIHTAPASPEPATIQAAGSRAG